MQKGYFVSESTIDVLLERVGDELEMLLEVCTSPHRSDSVRRIVEWIYGYTAALYIAQLIDFKEYDILREIAGAYHEVNIKIGENYGN